MVGAAGQSVSMVVDATAVLDVHDWLVGSKSLCPACLAVGEITLCEEVFERVVVSQNRKASAAIQVAAEVADSMDNSEELPLVHRVIALVFVELSRLISDGLEARTLVLEKDGTNCESGGVGIQSEGGVGASDGNGEDRRGSEEGFQVLKGILSNRVPLEGWRGARKVSERGGDGSEVRNEAAVVIKKTQEGADIGSGRWNRPGGDSSDLFRVNCDAMGGDDVTKELSRRAAKRALLELDMKVVGREGGKDLMEMGEMVFWSFGVDENVVQINNGEFVEERSQNVVH